MNKRKCFCDTMCSLYHSTLLYIVNKENGSIKIGKYKGNRFFPFNRNISLLYFTTNDTPFMQMVEIPNWNRVSVETNEYCLTPSKAYANEVSARCLIKKE